MLDLFNASTLRNLCYFIGVIRFKTGSVKFLPKLSRSTQGALVFKHLLAYPSHLWIIDFFPTFYVKCYITWFNTLFPTFSWIDSSKLFLYRNSELQCLSCFEKYFHKQWISGWEKMNHIWISGSSKHNSSTC